MDNKIRIVISGIGNRALPKKPETAMWSGWVEQIKLSDNFQLVGAHDTSGESIRRLVDRGYLKKSQTYLDLDLMLEEVPCDSIIISNPADCHVKTIQVAVEYNLHMLVEKPFVNSYAEGRRLVDIIDKKRLVVSIAQTWRCKDVGRVLHESIQRGLIGRVGHIFFRYIRDRENPNYPPYIFEENYPLLYAMGIHHLDLFRFILKDEFQMISGHSFKPPWSLYKSDTGLSLFSETKNGVSIVYSGTISSRNGMLPQESLVIEGDKGTLFNESQWLDPPLYFYPQGGKEKVDLTDKIKESSIKEQYNRSDQYILQNFYRSIIEKEKPVCSARDGLQSVAVLEVSKLACETGKEILVDEILDSNKNSNLQKTY